MIHAVGSVVPNDGTFAVVDRDSNVINNVAQWFNQGDRLPPVAAVDARGPFGYMQIGVSDSHAKAA